MSSHWVFSLALYVVCVNVGLIFAQISGESAATVASTPDVLLKLLREFDDFKKYLVTIDAQLKTLQKTLEQGMTSDGSQCSVRDITEAVKSHNFKLAEEKLNALADKTKVLSVVHDVYAGSPVNVDTIMDFAKSVTNGEATFLILNALRDEMRSSGDSDPYKLITLVEALERLVVKQKDEELKAKAQIVIGNAIEDVQVSATSILKTAMITGKYENNVEIENLASELFAFRNDVSNEVMQRVVDSVFGVVAAKRIIENISSHKNIPQVITGLTAIFNRFNYAGNLNNEATLNLASHLHQLQLREKYPSLSQTIKDDAEKVIEQLPLCAKNLFFSTNVCLWNKGRGTYLYAASSSISYDAERRSVYTWYQNDIKTGAFWQVEKIGDDFYFKNREHADEYMYSVGIDYNKDMRYVFTWVPGNNTDTQSAWAIELDGDYCYVRTAFYNEYLFAPKVKYDDQNNYVFTWKPGTSVRSVEFQWQIRNCGQAAGRRT